MIINKKEQLACIDISELKNYKKTDNLFFENPNRVIYILDRIVLKGIITYGDYKRNRLNSESAININCKKLIDSQNVLEEAEKIFSQNSNIHSIPVVSQQGILLYEISTQEDVEESIDLSSYITDTDWFSNYTSFMDIHKVCIIEYKRWGEKFKEKLGNWGGGKNRYYLS